MTQDRSKPAASLTPGEIDERQLIERLRSGDGPSQRQFYERYVGYLTAVCSRYVVDRDAVKDILQESFIRIFGHIGEFEYRGEGSVRAWVTRIVVNDSLKSLRGRGRLKYVDDLPDTREEEEDLPTLPQIPAAALQEMIRELPDGYRAVFNLFVFERKSHREIAALLGIKEDSSASQYFRARNTLARKIKAYVKEHAHE